MGSTRIVIAVAVGVVVALGAGCRSKRVGAACTGTVSTCVDPHTAIACRSGSFARVSCAGPRACSNFEEHANCDTTLASPGDPCMGEDGEYACTADKRRVSSCKAGRFEAQFECRGKTGCAITGRSFSCDQSIAEPGEACKTAGSTACTADAQQLVLCRDGKFVAYRRCRGKRGCTVGDEGPSCDQSISIAGDPCGVPGQIVCTDDGKAELVCQSGVFDKSLTCKHGCVVTNRPSAPVDCR